MTIEQISEKKAINDLFTEFPDTDFLVISRSVDRDLHRRLTDLLEAKKTANTKCVVFFTTYGGDPHGGYRAARCLRHHYPDGLRLVVPSFCKSAGTMIAIAADTLVIGDGGELGPLDVQVTKPNEFQERGSGLDITQALNSCLTHALSVFEVNFLQMRQKFRISTRQAGKLSAKIAADMLAPLYSQIDPLRIGELQRATAITLEYGKRLNTHSSNLKSSASLHKLVGSYPAHGFVIDRKEAKDLFNSVLPMSPSELNFYKMYKDVLQYETDFGPVLLESSDLGDENESNSPEITNRRISKDQPAGKTIKRPARSSKNPVRK